MPDFKELKKISRHVPIIERLAGCKPGRLSRGGGIKVKDKEKK